MLSTFLISSAKQGDDMLICDCEKRKKYLIKRIKKGKFVRKNRKINVESRLFMMFLEINIRYEISKFRNLITYNIEKKNPDDVHKKISGLTKRLINSIYRASIDAERYTPLVA
jgi:hypothetical protein